MPDFTGGYGFWKDVYDGQRHPGAEQAYADHRPQQNPGGAALRGVQGIFPE